MWNNWHLNCMRLSRVWTFLIITILYIYAIYHSINIYIEFKIDSMDLAYRHKYSPYVLNFYLASIIASLTFILLSNYFLLFYTGNLAHDDVRLGREDSIQMYCSSIFNCDSRYFCPQPSSTNSVSSKLYHMTPCVKRFWLRLKQSFLPFSALFHFLSAFCLMVPLPFVEAYQIKQRKLPPSSIWHTDLDFLFTPDKWHPSFVSQLNPGQPIWLMRPQFFNLIVSLISLSLRYPAVFWNTNRCFTFLFSLLMMLASVHIVLDICASSILVRLASNSALLTGKLHQNVISSSGIMTLTVIGSIILIIGFWTIFEFGFEIYLSQLRSNATSAADSDKSGAAKATAAGGRNSSDTACCQQKKWKNFSDENQNSSKAARRFRRYLPHLLALLVAGAVVAARSVPLLVVSINTVHRQAPDPLFVANLVTAALLLIGWLITWFAFALKPRWNFFVPNYSKAVSEISSVTQHTQAFGGINVVGGGGGGGVVGGVGTGGCSIGNGGGGGGTLVRMDQSNCTNTATNQVYACFHNNGLATLNGRLMRHNDHTNASYFMEDSEMQNSAASMANYVYLQSPVPPGYQAHQQSSLMPHLSSFSQHDDTSPFMVNRMESMDIETPGGSEAAVGLPSTPGGTAGVLEIDGSGGGGRGGSSGGGGGGGGVGGISESESSYDSATNIRNQICHATSTNSNSVGGGGGASSGAGFVMMSMRAQPGTGHRSSGSGPSDILKYVGSSSLRNQIASSEYIPMQQTTSSGLDSITSSGDTSTIRGTLPSSASQDSNFSSANIGVGGPSMTVGNSLQQSAPGASASLQRQSSKKRIMGQRVTFKEDPQLQDVAVVSPGAERSPNNSEQDSNNTTSSDSGIDSVSKQQHQLSNIVRSVVAPSTPNNIGPSNSFSLAHFPHNHYSSQQQPRAASVTPHIDNTYYNFVPSTKSFPDYQQTPTVTSPILIASTAVPISVPSVDTQSFVSDNEQDRLCSQV